MSNDTSQTVTDNQQAKHPKLFSRVGAFLVTLGFLMLFLVAQLAGVGLFASLVLSDGLTAEQLFGIGTLNGTVISLTMLFTWVVIVVSSYALIYWRLKRIPKRQPQYLPNALPKKKPSYQNSYQRKVSDYLAIRSFSWQMGLGFIGLWIIYLIATQALMYSLDKDPSAFVDDLYYSTPFKGLLILSMVVVVPIYEELIFRGVIWSAWREQMSGIGGVWLASIITSVLFAVIHLQYDLTEMSVILGLALLMSYGRYKSGSLLLPIMIHVLNNGIAMFLYINAL